MLDIKVIWVRPETKYFCEEGWTGKLAKHELICPSGKSVTCLTPDGGLRLRLTRLAAFCSRKIRHTPRKRGIQYAAASRPITNVSGILDHPLEPVIGLAEGETRWRVMTAVVNLRLAMTAAPGHATCAARGSGRRTGGESRQRSCSMGRMRTPSLPFSPKLN
jgi:hypothetical protein